MSYDLDTHKRRATNVGIWFGAFIVGTFAFAYMWNLYVGPYSTFYNIRAIQQQKAKTYLTTTTCTDPLKRSHLEGYNRCEEAEQSSTQKLSIIAFFDLMDDMKWCEKGVCLFGASNITNSMWFVFQLIMCFAAVLYIVSFFGLASSMWGRHSAMYQMPIHGNGMMMNGVQWNPGYQVAMQQKQETEEQAASRARPLSQSTFTMPTMYDHKRD